MKRHLITLLILIFSSMLTIGQDNILTFSGHVLDETIGTPVPGKEVIATIMSAGMTQTISMTTDNGGFYYDSLFTMTQGNYEVMTFDCLGIPHVESGFFNPGNMNIVHDFIICNDSIVPGCFAGFSYEVMQNPTGIQTVYFTDESVGSIDNWFWDFGDGNFSFEQNPTHMYNSFGPFQVCLTISSNDSTCYDVFCVEVELNNTGGDCENFFWYETWDNVSFEFMGESVPFPADLFFWDFGDGTTGEGPSVSHVYDPNVYDSVIVTLTTISFDPVTLDSCMATSSQPVAIGGNTSFCQNWFFYNSNDNYTFTFEGEGLPPASYYEWDFGDNQTATGQTVEHTYDESFTGNVQVSLTTYHMIPGSADTCVAISYQGVWVGGNTTECTNWFTFEPMGNSSFMFMGESDPPADIYLWNFGDGATAEGPAIDHTYEPGGTGIYLVTLTTFHQSPIGDSCVAISSMEVIVENNGGDCDNWFWYETSDNITFDFMGESFPVPANSYFWDFGDGTTATGQSATHSYDPVTGEQFVVTLLTTSFNPNTGDSCMAESSQVVWVGGNGTGCENMFWFDQVDENTFNFMGESFPIPATEFFWEFGDGTTGVGPSVEHTFDPAMGDMFTVCLTTYAWEPTMDSCFAVSCQDVSLNGNTGDEIYGHIWRDSEPADFALVGLFGMNNNGSFSYEFTMTTPGSGLYHFNNVAPGDYYIFASLTPQSGAFYDYFPTYYGDAMFWFDSDLISIGDPQNPYDIELVPITTITSGPGSISGSITMGDTKAGPGENIMVMLMNENGDPLRFMASNDEGLFSFSDLALGTYKVAVEMPGVASEVVTITLDENNMESSLAFIVKSNSAFLSIDEQQAFATYVGEVYPNPASSKAHIDMVLIQNTDLQVNILNQLGQVVKSFNKALAAGNQSLEIPLSGLTEGLYHLQVISDKGMIMKRLIK
ncbi:MAG: T9SS type A sorting domain-containing protein [Bacteroidales bacterium]|nr:T9SS type A sorting domain-containing protein [Bacteroidales bacterium]